MLTDAEWPLRDKFLAALRAKLAAIPNRVAYYPGSHKKHAGGQLLAVPLCCCVNKQKHMTEYQPQLRGILLGLLHEAHG